MAPDLYAGAWTRFGRFLRRVPRQDRARAMVSAILEAAEDSLDLAESGKLQALFARAGVAAGSFYEYFSSRDALLGTVIERITERNFETLFAAIDEAAAGESDFELVIRRCADLIVRHYLRHPTRLRTVIRLVDRLGLLAVVGSERDRFADLLAERTARFAPTMSAAARSAMIRAGAEVLTGLVVVSVYRSPMPPVDDIARGAGDAVWGVLWVHLERGG
jgi:AcrR family transcriptional regulator